MDYKDFAQRIKAKHPEYSDLSDLDLAQKMVAKFPKDYGDVSFDDPLKVNGLMDNLAADAKQEVSAMPWQRGAGAATAVGHLGKAASDYVADVPVVGTAAKFLLPQNGTDAAVMALSGPIGEGLGAAGTKILESKYGAAGIKIGKAAGESLTEGAKNMLRYAESKGIKLTPADMSGSSALKAFENLLEKTPLGSEAIGEYRAQATAAIKKMRDALAERLGTREDATVLDQIAKNAIVAAKEAHDAKSDVLYQRLGELAGDAPIDMPRQAMAAIKVLKDEMRLHPDRQNEAIKDLVSKVLGVEPEFLTAENVAWLEKNPGAHAVDYANYNGNRRLLGKVLSDDQAARAMGAQYSSQEAGAAKKLFTEGEKDLAAFSKKNGSELEEAHTLATTWAKEGHRTFDNQKIKQLMRTNPGGLVKAVFRPDPTATTAIDAVKKAAGGETGGAWQALRKQFVADLIPEVGEKFNPLTFANNLQKYEKAGVLRSIFSDAEIREFKGLANASKLVESASRIQGAQGSARTNVQLGQTVLAGAAGISGAVMHGPVGGAIGMSGAILAPKALAELYLSPAGRKLLMEGFTVPIASPKAAKVAASIATYLSLKASSTKETKP